jgi:hypothetical protein
MSVLAPLKECGVAVTLAGNHKLVVQGHGDSTRAINYVRRNKEAIIRELSSRSTEGTKPDSWGLPLECPLLDKPVPGGCRFEAKLYRRMVNEGVLQLGGPCPLLNVCILDRQGKETTR